MSTTRFFWRLVLYQRWLYLLNAVLWIALYLGPILPGLVIRRFFNHLEAGSSSTNRVLVIAALLADRASLFSRLRRLDVEAVTA